MREGGLSLKYLYQVGNQHNISSNDKQRFLNKMPLGIDIKTLGCDNKNTSNDKGNSCGVQMKALVKIAF